MNNVICQSDEASEAKLATKEVINTRKCFYGRNAICYRMFKFYIRNIYIEYTRLRILIDSDM